MNLNQSEACIQAHRKLIKIIMLAISIVGEAEGRVQISVLVSDKPMCVFEKVFC